MYNYYLKTWVPVFDGDDLVADLEGQLSKITDTASLEYKKTQRLLESAKVAVEVKGGRYVPQDRVNALLAEDKRKHQDAHRKTLEELEALKTRSTLSAEERADLEKRIEETQKILRTKEETSAQEREKLIKNHKKDIETATSERDQWKTRFTKSTIKQSIISAAAGSNPKAVNPDQILVILQPNTRLVEELGEDGKPTGELVPRVSFADKDSKGKPVVLDLSPDEAVKRMSEMEEHFNLFSAEGLPGFHKFRAAKGKELSIKALAKDPAAYREARKSGQLKY